MKKLLLIVFLVALGNVAHTRENTATIPTVPIEFGANNRIGPKANQTQVKGAGVVSRMLSDDNEGSRHQRFILRLKSGQTLLIAHNIDIAPRLNNLKVGDTVEYYGEYKWNSKGGVVHWTHRDPSGKHVAGWLKHDGRFFQ